MLKIELIREKPEWIKEQIANLNDVAPIDEILVEDRRRREIIQTVEVLRQQRNEASKEIGRWMGGLNRLEKDLKNDDGHKDENAVEELEELKRKINTSKTETRDIGQQIALLDDELREVEARLHTTRLRLDGLLMPGAGQS